MTRRKNFSQGYVSVNVFRHKTQQWENVCLHKPNLLTNGGKDFYFAQVLTNASAGTRGSNYMGVTNTGSFTPSVTDTTMSGELAVNGFSRADSSGAGTTHTAGTNSCTITHTYTATGTQTLIQGSGLFNASSAGTLTHEASFTSTDLVTNDTLAVTWTIQYT